MHELQKQVWKGSEERNGKRREGKGMRRRNTKKQEDWKRNGDKEKKKIRGKWEEIEAKKNKMQGNEVMVPNESNKGKGEERLCGILRNFTTKKTTQTKIFIRHNI